MDNHRFDPPRNKRGAKRSALPDPIGVVSHVAGRLREVKKLYNCIATTKTEMLVHQMLPNHMRRRAMSHNPKRLPLKYRKIHINQMTKSGPTAKKKRPSRKYRRKPSNLMLEYNRRKQRNVWLETHIWHAKRYHMKDLWGYRVPVAPTDKRYRASYRAAANHCLVQDISYVGGIEISGPLDVLKEQIYRITSQDCGPTLMAKCFEAGTREGNVDVFKTDCYPNNAIARVSFMCKPTHDETNKTLWIFIHPTAYREVLEELIVLFQLQNAYRNDSPDENDLQVITINESTTRNPKYINRETGVEVMELKDTLNRFRLTGPFSNAVLLKALKVASHFEGNWLGNLMDEDFKYQKAHLEQERLWKELVNVSSPAELPPHTILALNVVDPRTNRPTKREKAQPSVLHRLDYSFEVPPVASVSGIWNKKLRDNLIKNMTTSGELCKLRNENQLVPGIPAAFESKLQPLPILLIQRPGSQSSERKRLGLGCGWDVIVPSGYGLHVWLSLIKCGAKSGGWREISTINSEMGMEVFLPDTVSGKKDNERQQKLMRDEYFRKPPNKRTNFKKIGISSPFACPFSQLVSEWNGGNKFHVLRNRQQLASLNEVLRSKGSFSRLDVPADALIAISLVMETRGLPGDCGIVCLPTKRDIKNHLAQTHRRDKGPVHSEPEIADAAEGERKLLRTSHKRLLKRLRNRRVRAKRKLQATANCHVKIQKSSAEKTIEEHYKRMCELWLPTRPLSVKNQCSRPVLGYLTNSRFNFSEGRVCGLGYVTQNAFAELLKVFQKFKGLKPFVLCRSTNSRCYHVAALHVREVNQ